MSWYSTAAAIVAVAAVYIVQAAIAAILQPLYGFEQRHYN